MASHSSRRPLSRSASTKTTGSRTPIQHAAGMALQLPKSAALAAQEPMAGVFGELDALLGLCSDRHREHGKALVADLSRTLDGAVQCRDYASTLLKVDDSSDSCLHTDHKGKPSGHQLFAELDGMLHQSDAVVERVAAPRLSPFMKEMEALMAKVANESSALSEKHQVEPAAESEGTFDESADHELLRSETEEEEVPALQMTAECTEPLFAELESLLHEVPDQLQEQRALEASLARVVSSTLESQEQADLISEQLLHGDDIEDPAHTAWRRNALELLKGEATFKKGMIQTASSSASAKPALSFSGTKPSTRRSTITGAPAPASRSVRAMSCIG